MPPKLPQEAQDQDLEQEVNVALCNNLIEAAQDAATASFNEVDLQHALSDVAIGGTSM
jgi:hypothetical protein